MPRPALVELEARARGKAELVQQEEGAPFEIVQNANSGAISVDSLWLMVGKAAFVLERPLNSRDAWPLYAIRMDDLSEDEIQVFTDDGDLTPEFEKLVGLKVSA
jgi:hypothetical protein